MERLPLLGLQVLFAFAPLPLLPSSSSDLKLLEDKGHIFGNRVGAAVQVNVVVCVAVLELELQRLCVVLFP